MLQAYTNDSLILRIPVIDIVNAIVPKTPLTHGNGSKLASNETKVIYTNEQVVAALVHFKGNTYSVLNRVATNVSYFFCLKAIKVEMSNQFRNHFEQGLVRLILPSFFR